MKRHVSETGYVKREASIAAKEFGRNKVWIVTGDRISKRSVIGIVTVQCQSEWRPAQDVNIVEANERNLRLLSQAWYQAREDEKVKALVLRTKSLEIYSKEVWRQSYSVGSIARAISPLLQMEPERGFLIGLLHDLGKVVLLSMLSKASEKASDIPVISHDDMVWADGYFWSAPTRYGSYPSQVRAFIDTLGPLWMQGKLANKVYAGKHGYPCHQ